MKLIKKAIIGQKVSKRSKKQGPAHLAPFDQVRRIALLAQNESEANEASKALQSSWPHEVQVNFIYPEKNPAHECYDYGDFNLLGKPNEKIRAFLEQPADLILVTQSEMDALAAHLVQLLPNAYRIGFFNEANQKHLNLMLEKEAVDLSENIANLLKYLRKINC